MEHVQPRLPYEYLLHAACDCCEVLARDCERVNCANNNEAIFISDPKAFRACSKFAAINNPGCFLEYAYIPCFGMCMPHPSPFHWGMHGPIPSWPGIWNSKSASVLFSATPVSIPQVGASHDSWDWGQCSSVSCKQFRFSAGLSRDKEQRSLNW